MNKNETPVTEAPAVEVAEVVEQKKCIVNCPKCSTALFVKLGNFAHLCPVCSNVFRTRVGEKLVKCVTRQTMVEAYVTIDKDAKGEVKTESVVNELDK